MSTAFNVYDDAIFARCRVCGEIVYRNPGHVYGDGSHDTDDAPVWLSAPAGIVGGRVPDIYQLPEVMCGCND